MSNLNKFKDSYQVLEKNPRLSFMIKKVQGSYGMSKQLLLAQDFLPQTLLCVIVYKVYECDKNQMPYCNVESFKKSNL